MAGPPGCVMRRRLMLTALSGATALALGARGTAAPQNSAQPKMTQKQAEYQDEPKGGIMMCGTCTLFIPPAECKVVEGYVAITGWCNAFDLAD
jgi:hypothetical protein